MDCYCVRGIIVGCGRYSSASGFLTLAIPLYVAKANASAK
jgi:hypothetical protein